MTPLEIYSVLSPPALEAVTDISSMDWGLHRFFCVSLYGVNRLKILRHVFLWGYRFLSVFVVCLTPPMVKMSAGCGWGFLDTGEAPDEGIHDMEGRQSLLVCQRCVEPWSMLSLKSRGKKAKIQPLYFPYAALFPRPRLFIVLHNNFSPWLIRCSEIWLNSTWGSSHYQPSHDTVILISLAIYIYLKFTS